MDIETRLLAALRSADEAERVKAVADVLFQAEIYVRSIRRVLAGIRPSPDPDASADGNFTSVELMAAGVILWLEDVACALTDSLHKPQGEGEQPKDRARGSVLH